MGQFYAFVLYLGAIFFRAPGKKFPTFVSVLILDKLDLHLYQSLQFMNLQARDRFSLLLIVVIPKNKQLCSLLFWRIRF